MTTSLTFHNRIEVGMKLLIVVVASMVLIACGMSAEDGLSDQRCVPYEEAGVPCELPLVAILANPKAYERMPVTIGGFLGGEASPGALYSSREAWAIGDRSSSILLSSEDDGVMSDALKYKFSYVVVSGALNAVEQRRSRQPNLVFSVNSVVRIHQPDNFSDSEMRIIEGRREAGN